MYTLKLTVLDFLYVNKFSFAPNPNLGDITIKWVNLDIHLVPGSTIYLKFQSIDGYPLVDVNSPLQPQAEYILNGLMWRL